MHSGLKLDKMYILGMLAQFIIFKQMNTDKLINIDVLKNYIIMYFFLTVNMCVYACTLYYFLHIWQMSLNFLKKINHVDFSL